MTEEKRETKYNQLVGRIGDEYYFLDYTFHHGDDFKGATGSELSPLTEDEYNERVESYFDPENMRDSWRQAVSDSSTDLNHVNVTGECIHGKPVWDEDSCYVHCSEKSREINTPFLNFLDSHPNMFPLLQRLLQRLGL